jgi:diguanylate cyclase (GGDEF)-like protein/PAS domain S-box-containing protein
MINTVAEITQKSGCYSGTGGDKFQQKVNILLVDNNVSNILILEKFLKDLEYHLVTANSIDAALSYLSSYEFAVILLDMEMPGVEELANAKFLRKHSKNPNTPTILLTTSSNLEQVVLKGCNMGTVDYLLKPIVPQLLLAKVSVFVNLFAKTLQLTQAEEALLACGVRLSGILDNSSDAVILINSAQLITIFNREAERIFGYTSARVLNRPIDLLFPDCANNQQFQQIFTSFQAKTSLDNIKEHCEIVGCRQDGTKFPLEASMFPLELVNGNYFTIILRDVSARKATEAALRKIEANFQAFMNHSPLLYWITDSKGQFVYCNRSFENWCDRSVLEVIGKTIFDLYPPDIAQQQLNCIQYITSTGNACELNESILNSNGKVYDFLTYHFPLFDANGQTLIGGVAIDITERKQAEAALVLRNQQLLTLHKISEIALNTESLEAAYRETVTEISLATCFPVVAIELYNRERQVMEFIGITGIPEPSCDRLECPINQTLSGMVVLTGQPLVKVFQPEETTIHSINPILKHLDLQTFVCQPMLVNQQVIGTLSLAHPERIQTDASFLRWIGSLANFVASLVERKQAQQALQLANSQLNSWVKELEIRNREIASLGELSDILQACVSVDEAHQALAQLIQHLFPDVSGAVFVLNRERNLLEAVAVWGNVNATTELFFEAQDCWGLRRGRLHLTDTQLLGIPCHHRKQKSSSQSSTESLCIPMMAQGEALGMLYLSSDEPGKLKAKQQFGVTTAEHIAVGLANLKLHEALKQQSICDPLTGLFNRRYLEETLEREVHRAKRQQSTIGIVMIDIDYFKRFNDTFGHNAGDAVLQELAIFLKKHIREGDIACRYGGEEMILILPLASLATTLERAEMIREGVKHLVLQYHDRNLDPISLSLGVACYPEHGLTSEVVMKAADAALYCAKQQGRDRVCISQP